MRKKNDYVKLEKKCDEKRLQRDINESISSIEGNKIKFKSLDFQDSRIIL